MRAAVVFGILALIVVGSALLALFGPTEEVRVSAGIVTMIASMIFARPISKAVVLRRYPYRSSPELLELEAPSSVPPPARDFLVAMNELVVGCGFENVATIRVDRGSYTFVCILEHAEARTVALVSWHGSARSIAFETMIGGRRRTTICSDTMIDLPSPDDVDRVELSSLSPRDVLAVHRKLVMRGGSVEVEEDRSLRENPLEWMRAREQRTVAMFVKSGIATTSGDDMRFTWRGAVRAVLSTSWPVSTLTAAARARRTRELLAELGLETA